MSRAEKPSALWCIWQFLKGMKYNNLEIPDADLSGKWIIITGSNSGIGREAALQFAKWGASLVLGCREPPPHEPHPDDVVKECRLAASLAGHSDATIEWWKCDMARLSSVQAFGERWLQTGRPLNILANNAGIADRPRVVEITGDGFEFVHQVNFLSHALLTMILLPSLKLAPEPRIICTTSCAQYVGVFDLSNANSTVNSYANNKLYFQTWLTELQHRMEEQVDYKHITAQGLHPGYVKTNIWIKEPDTNWARGEGVLGILLKFIGIDAQQGSLAISYAATRPAPSTDPVTQGGTKRWLYSNRIWQEEPMPQTMDPDCRREVWEFVEKELKLEERGLLNGLGV